MSFQPRLFRIFSFALVTLLAGAASSHADVVRFNTNLGSFDVDLYEDVTPQTVANFLFYLDNGDYTQSLLHRSDPGFVIQGGGFYRWRVPDHDRSGYQRAWHFELAWNHRHGKAGWRSEQRNEPMVF